MSKNATNTYDFDIHVAEIHDQVQAGTLDVDLVLRLIGRREGLRILEPFCGTGRILIPLALAGHHVVGMDQAATMLERAQTTISQLPPEVRRRITLLHADATASGWPEGFDVVLVGSNCLYELACPQEQEACIASAAGALRAGGHVFVDNDHMEGDLAESWRQLGRHPAKFPRGLCADGTRVEGTSEVIWYDAPSRLVQFHRTITVISPDGRARSTEWVQQKHPVSTEEVRMWLARQGLAIEHLLGRDGSAYTDASSRATFWAVKQAFAENNDGPTDR